MSDLQAIVHIGTEKTGTTTVQQCFGGNREVLLTSGILYPEAPANRYHNHVGLAAYAASDHLIDDIRRHLGINDSGTLARYRRSLESALYKEVAEVRSRIQTLVFSNEHCHSRLVSADEIVRIRNLLAPVADTISIVVYLRRQDRMAVSLYSTYLRSGGTRKAVFPDQVDMRYFDFDRLLDMWASVFGEDAIKPRIYEPSMLENGDVVQDLAALIRQHWSPDFGARPRTNESFSPAAQEIVRHLNERLAQGDVRLAAHDIPALIDRMTAAFAGPGRRPAKDDAAAFYQQFRDSNERVRQRWFPDRATLFDEDFSHYPEADDAESLSIEDAADLLVELVRPGVARPIGDVQLRS